MSEEKTHHFDSKDSLDQNTRLKRSQEEELLWLVFNSSAHWEFLLSIEGVFTYCSESISGLTGLSPANLKKDPALFEKIIHEEDREFVQRHIENTRKSTGIAPALSFRIITRSRNVKWVEMHLRPLFTERGEYLGLRGTISDVSGLKKALGQIETISVAGQYEKEAKLRFQEQAELKDRELTASLLRMVQKNELLKNIKQQLENVNSDQPEIKARLSGIIARINSDAHSQGQWEEFRIYFERNHPGFFVRLTARFPSLTTKEIKLAAYLRLHLNTKEIANLMNISPKSMEVSRVRLRKKLGLENRENLSVFLARL